MRDTDQPRTVRFGVFEVDVSSGELRKNGVKVKLQEQPFRVLVALLQREGEVVTREELRQELWSTDTFVDFDHSLNAAVKRLRDALDDTADNPRFIETLPRRGYRFIPGKFLAPQTKAAHPLQKRLGVALVAASLLLASFLLVRVAWTGSRSSRRNNPQARSLAVLPLQNLSGDPAQEYFADGITDELITELAELKSVRVISRTSVMQYKGAQKPLRQIANELSVDAILEGSVLRSGQHVRVTSQLIDAATDQHLWARTYDRELGDVLLLQSDMAGEIAREIRAEMNGNARPVMAQVSRVDPEEHDLYFRGRYHLSKGSEDEINKGIEYFRQG